MAMPSGSGIARANGIAPAAVRPTARRQTRPTFHLIRQNAAGSAAVLIHRLDVLAAVLSVEREPGRRAALRRHAGLVLQDGERSIGNPADPGDLRRHHAAVGRDT